MTNGNSVNVASYSVYVADGTMTEEEAKINQSLRDSGRKATEGMIAFHKSVGNPADAYAFGALDAVVVEMVGYYGGEATAEVLRHYAEVAARQQAKAAK